MSRLSHCWLVAIVTIAFYSSCGHTQTTVAAKDDEDCGKDVSDEILFYYSGPDIPNPVLFKARDATAVDALKLTKAEPTVFITHGYLENSHHPSCELIRRAYLSGKEKIHVIVVDWSFANKDLLSTAKKQMTAVGNEIADLITAQNEKKLTMATTTLVGHSLGAHVMGIAGRKLGAKVKQIIALDPTFTSLVKPQALQLSPSAAINVQVIHAFSYGESKALGHVDFYANGPQNRPSCSSGICTHGHAYEYFAESLTSKDGFKAQKCRTDQNPSRDCSEGDATVGGRTPDSALSGKYYFETNAESPYIIREPRPKADSLTMKILRMRNNMSTSMRNSWQRLFGK